MQTRTSYGQSVDLERRESLFRIIDPEEYPAFGIQPEDIPMGTFAAEDHPGFLPSRYGGNAYGLGLIEQELLTREDTDFLESIDFENPLELRENAPKLNAVYRKLGLLIRFSSIGRRYYLIPINLVAHSLQDVKTKADEIESNIKRRISETNSENLNIGILTTSDDLIVHELTARLSSQRIHLFDTLEKIRTWHMPLDMIVLPRDPLQFLLSSRQPGTDVRRKDPATLGDHLALKLYDMLDEAGRLLVLTDTVADWRDRTCRVHFKREEELKWFLIFSHTFKTREKYISSGANSSMEVHVSDLHYYLNRFAFSEPQLRKLLRHQKPEELSLEEIDGLPFLNIPLGHSRAKGREREWRRIFEPLFEIDQLERKHPCAGEEYWRERIEIEGRLPESLLVMSAARRRPAVELSSLEEEIRESGVQGSPLALAAEYRKSFKFVLSVLKVLKKIRDFSIERLTELEMHRLAIPFRIRAKGFRAVLELLDLIPKIERIAATLHPNPAEGREASIVDNLEKLSLLGFSRQQLREILLIVVGHTTMSRIVFGKVPAKTLKSVTDRVREEDRHEVFDLLRMCRLMSIAEIIASHGDAFMGEQVSELFRVYDEAITVTTNPELDWDKLEDLRVSALGGVQNKAVREMLKFFNLFEFLNNWAEYRDRGTLEKEVVCDYDPGRIERMEDAIQLAKVAEEFKRKFLGDHIFGQTYFFRQFLDTEFHGTGPVFRELGTRAGFILLWIAVNSSDKNTINFNPILGGIPEKEHPTRLKKLRDALLRLPVDRLDPALFKEIKVNFNERRPAFIFDSGIRLILDGESRVLDVSFVDVQDGIKRIESLLLLFESRKLGNISLKTLREMENRFSEIMSFYQHLKREGCSQCSVAESSNGLEQKSRKIEDIASRLRAILLRQILVPEEVHDNIGVLRGQCPELLNFMFPELRGLGFLSGISPEPESGSLEDYVMRCVQKYQALVNRDRNSFQDRNTFYRLAKQEFGPLAEEGVGATYPQLECLEFFIGRVRENPMLLNALTFAIIFQEIGKLDIASDSEPENYWTHGRRGSEILRKLGILKKYDLDPQTEERTIFLVQHHGLLGHVFLGEEPVTSLETITSEKDSRLLDAFVVHSVLASAAVSEGVMVSDFLERFIKYRAIGLQVIESGTTWESFLREVLEEKGKAVLDEFQFEGEREALFPADRENHCGIIDKDIRNENLWQGRQSAAFERLLKLTGSLWVDYEDLQMYLRKIPISFIYHKKRLKSVGPGTFEEQMRRGAELLDLLSSLSSEVRYYLLYCLDHLGGAMRIYDFQKIAERFGLRESLKILIFSLQAFHQMIGSTGKNGLISFSALARELGRKNDLLKNMLMEIPFPTTCFDGERVFFTPDRFTQLGFEGKAGENAESVTLKDTVHLDSMRNSLGSVWDNRVLLETYERTRAEIQRKSPFGTEDFLGDLEKAFRSQQDRISERVLEDVHQKLAAVTSILEFETALQEIESIESEFSFSERQRFLLHEMSETHRSRIRDTFLNAVYEELNSLDSKEDLLKYWGGMKCELFRYRSYVGKEYERLMAKFVDEKLEKLSGESDGGKPEV